MYKLIMCHKLRDTDPSKYIELDTDGTMYLSICFQSNRDVAWRMLISQADRCFGACTYESKPCDGQGHICHEREYDTKGYTLGKVLLSNDYADGTISVSLRVPQSGRVIDQFTLDTALLVNSCDVLSSYTAIALADNSLEDQLQNI